MAAKKSTPASGAPRWTYVVGTLVGVTGLVWGIISFILTDRIQTKPVAPAATQVSVSGSGNVGVGTMSGGSITVGTRQGGGVPETTRASR